MKYLGTIVSDYDMVNKKYVDDSIPDVSGFITTETDPTVPSWAKASSKPSYTASEVGAVPTTRTVNSKALSSNITLSASDVGAVPTTRTVNSKALSSDISLTASDVGAVALSDKYTRSSAGHLDWTNQTDGDSKVIAKSALAYWNGRYNGSASNLAYCNKGAFGTFATKNVADVSSLFTMLGKNIVSSTSLASGTYATYTYSWTGQSNCYPLGIVGINSSGNNSVHTPVVRYMISNQAVGSCDISVTVKNTSSATATLTIAVYVLWVKTNW